MISLIKKKLETQMWNSILIWEKTKRTKLGYLNMSLPRRYPSQFHIIPTTISSTFRVFIRPFWYTWKLRSSFRVLMCFNIHVRPEERTLVPLSWIFEDLLNKWTLLLSEDPFLISLLGSFFCFSLFSKTHDPSLVWVTFVTLSLLSPPERETQVWCPDVSWWTSSPPSLRHWFRL